MEQIAIAHKKNMILWSAILAGMLILIAMTYYFDSQVVFTPVNDSGQIGQYLFILAVIIAVVILILKRNVLSFGKVLPKVMRCCSL